MILTWLYQLLGDFVGWTLNALPAFNVDVSMAGPNGILAPVADYAVDLSGWIPWGTITLWFPIVFGIYTASILARALRFFKQLIPLIG